MPFFYRWFSETSCANDNDMNQGTTKLGLVGNAFAGVVSSKFVEQDQAKASSVLACAWRSILSPQLFTPDDGHGKAKQSDPSWVLHFSGQ